MAEPDQEPESDQQLVARIEIEVRVENLDKANFDIQIIKPRAMFTQMPGEFVEDPEEWAIILVKVVPLTNELAHIAELAIGRHMENVKKDPRLQ